MSNISVNTRTRPEAVIADDHVAVEPGQFAQTTMTVRNTGSEIAEYSVSMVPDSVPGPWMDAVPATFRLMPGREQQIILRFQPPLDSSTDAGTFPYGVLIMPDEVEHQAQIVVEGDVSVGAIHALEVKLSPRLSKGRWRGKHIVTMHNRGTEDTRVKLQAVDEDDALSLALAPTSLTVPARTTVEAFLSVRPRSPQIMGKPVEHPFQVAYRRRVDGRSASTASLPSGGEIEASVSGSFRHKPILSPPVILLGLLLIGVIALLLILRPWEKAAARQPPDPIVISGSTDGTKVVLTWNNPSDISEILVQEVTCETASNVLPTAVGEPLSFTPSGASQSQPLEAEFDLGSTHCFQARAVSPRGTSVWAPSPAELVVVGSEIPAPEITVQTDGCGIVVDWPQVETAGDVEYVVSINDGAQEPVTGGPQPYKDLDPGEVRVFVRTVVGESKSAPSTTQTANIPADCTGEGGEGGESGEGGEGGPDGPGGSDDTTTTIPVVDLREQVFLLINPLDAEFVFANWQAIAAKQPPNGAGMDKIPAIGVPGETLLLTENIAQAFPGGRSIIYIRGYPTTAEGEQAARSDCANLNQVVVDVNDSAFGNCFLIVPERTPEYVDPPETTTTTAP